MNEIRGIRAGNRALRDAMPELAREEASRKICDVIRALPQYRAARTIFAYAPLGSEADIFPLVYEAICQGKRVALPRVLSPGEMRFYRVTDPDTLEPGTFGVREPAQDAEELSPMDADMILVPGVAFNEKGERIGYGGGFYDRYLPQTTAYRVMAAFACQQAEFSGQAHDVRMDAVATQDGIREVPGEV